MIRCTVRVDIDRGYSIYSKKGNSNSVLEVKLPLSSGFIEAYRYANVLQDRLNSAEDKLKRLIK